MADRSVFILCNIPQSFLFLSPAEGVGC